MKHSQSVIKCSEGMSWCFLSHLQKITYIFSPSGLMVSIAIRRRPSFPKQILSIKQQLHYYLQQARARCHCNSSKYPRTKCVTWLFDVVQSICIVNHSGHLGLDSRLVSPQLNKFICQFHINLTWHLNRFTAKRLKSIHDWEYKYMHHSQTHKIRIYLTNILKPLVATGTLFWAKQKLSHSFSHLKNRFNMINGIPLNSHLFKWIYRRGWTWNWVHIAVSMKEILGVKEYNEQTERNTCHSPRATDTGITSGTYAC